MENQIVIKYLEHSGFDNLPQTVQQISAEYGFSPGPIVHRRYIYEPDKLWRVRLEGAWQGRPAMLRVENIKLETDEESIRQAFRAQSQSAKIRPPKTFLSRPFEDKRGYAFSIEEKVDGQPLFDPAGEPETACAAFASFYRELRHTIRQPFWDAPQMNAREFSISQMDKWLELAREIHPEHTAQVEGLAVRLKAASLESMGDKTLRFQHAHLSGADVRVTPDGEYVVFANHYWRWGQPGYDLAFLLWGMWLALPPDRSTPQDTRRITDAWMTMMRRSLNDLVTPDELLSMLFNRLYGSFLLDLPARQKTKKSAADTDRLQQALMVEADRLLS